MTNEELIEKLREGCVLHPRRWSGDTREDLGGAVDQIATDRLMEEAATVIEGLAIPEPEASRFMPPPYYVPAQHIHRKLDAKAAELEVGFFKGVNV